MADLLLSLFTAAPAWMIYAIAGAIGFLGVYVKGRSDGKDAEKIRQIEVNSAAKNIADEIDAAVAGREPVKNRERLSKWSR